MERINEASATVINRPPQNLSRIQSNGTPTISPEKHTAIFLLINKSRMLNGWQPSTAAQLDLTIRTWAEVFDRHEIPIAAYPKLLSLAITGRAEIRMRGDDPGQMGAEYILSLWLGPNGLKAQMRNEQIAQRNTLPNNAAGACPRCHGSGWESLDGGARRCNHEREAE